MNRYGEYKKIEAQWLGTIPSHWDSPQLREILKERKEKVSDKEFSPLSVCKAGIVPQLSTAAKSNAGDNRKAVRKGDFVINSRSDRRGSSGISKYEGSVSLISHVLSPRGDVADNFLHYLLRSHNFIEEFYRNGRGIAKNKTKSCATLTPRWAKSTSSSKSNNNRLPCSSKRNRPSSIRP